MRSELIIIIINTDLKTFTIWCKTYHILTRETKIVNSTLKKIIKKKKATGVCLYIYKWVLRCEHMNTHLIIDIYTLKLY